MNKNNNKIKKIVIVALFSALFYLLSVIGTIKVNNFIKLTFQNLPLFISGMLYGGLISSTVGTVGMFISQLFSPYGLTATTILWILPHTLGGFFSGVLYKIFKNKLNNRIFVIIYLSLVGFIITFMNTIAQVVDSKIQGYYNKPIILGSLLIRLLNVLLISILYSFIIPIIIKTIKKIDYFK